MSSNHHEKNNESIDGFNLSKEELMNCFGSQISSQSSKSNYDYQNDYNLSDIQLKNMGQNQNQNQIQAQNKNISDNSKSSKNCFNKDEILKTFCHGFIDMFFSQKEELRGIKDEIRKLQSMMINNNNNNNYNNNNKRPLTKKIKINNQKSLVYNQNNNINNNENYNHSYKNSKKNLFSNNNNNPFIEEQNNQIVIQPKKENKKDQKKQMMPILANTKKPRGKSPNIHINQKVTIPETVVEVDEEDELTTTCKQNRIKEKEKEKENLIKKEFEDPFLQEIPEENNFRFEDINDDEFDAILKKGKNKKGNINPFLGNDPFIKSSELKKRPEHHSSDKENNSNSNDMNNANNNLILNLNGEKENENENESGMINFDNDEIISDFMVGGKKINIKINDDIRNKINALNEPIDKLEELDKNKKPSNILHKTSKLSCTSNSIISKAKNIQIDNNSMNNDSKVNEKKEIKGMKEIKEITTKLKPVKRNHNTMMENSKKILENEKENLKKEEEKNNGSSIKERGGFRKRLKKFGNSNEYNMINLEISKMKNNSNPSSLNTSQNKVQNTKKANKKIKNTKYMYSTISSCQFYCLCTKNDFNNSNNNKKCNICKDTSIININNFMEGFYHYIIYMKEKNNNVEIDTSDSTFKLLIEKDKENSQLKELEQFFIYQFSFLTFEKYFKISIEKNTESQIENLIEEIYNKLIPKYTEVFIKGKRSFLTEVSEGDSTLGHMNILLLLMNINNNSDSSTEDKMIEFSDGYKSCYAVINSNDPINKLMNNVTLHNWMNVEIGMSKVLNITEDFKVFIKIYYNSISPAENIYSIKNNYCNYGPLLDKKFLPKNILELKNNGGEISLINVIIIKKYDFFVNNKTKKIRISRKKYENEIMKIPDSDRKNYNNNDSEGKNVNNSEIKEPDKIFFTFKTIAMDYEIYNNIKKIRIIKTLLNIY